MKKMNFLMGTAVLTTTAVGATALTLADWSKRLNPDGKGIAPIVEMLSQKNEILEDMLFIEGNLPTGHRSNIRTGLPEAAWRKLNYGTPQSKSHTVTVDDTCGMLEARGQIDEKLWKLNGSSNEFRLSENQAFIEAMNQNMARTVLYGDTDIDPEKILGLIPRYNDFSAANADNLIDGGGEGSDNTSIMFVGWGADSICGIFPKGAQAGLRHEDLGVGDAFDANNNRFRAVMDLWQWDTGLFVRDWRYGVRICNIDVAALRTDAAALKNLVTLMIMAEERMQDLGMKTAIYCNRTIRTALRLAILEKISNNLTNETVAGKRVTMWNGIPVRIVDQFLNTEARVVPV